MQNAVPKAFRTLFLKSSKTKTNTKYLILTSCDDLALVCGWLLKRWVKVLNQSSSKLREPPGHLIEGRNQP